MVKNRQATAADIPELRFVPPAGTPIGVEVMSLRQLRSRQSPSHFQVPRRPTFHHLLTLDRGRLRHAVDLSDFTVGPGAWLWVRPGQIQHWGDLRRADGTLILFEPDFLDQHTAVAAQIDDPHAPVVYEPTGDDQHLLSATTDALARTFDTPSHLPLDVQQAVLRHLLAALLLRLAHLRTCGEHHLLTLTDAFLRFRDAVERDFTRTRRVQDYAHALGYSARTLTRASQAAAGVNAKDYIDRRTILEAKRLLAHTDHTAAQIATRLGFTSATNFTKYFHQRTGAPPIAFRAASHPDGHQNG